MISEEFVANVIAAYPYDGKVALDLGAHKGKFTELLAKKFEKVYAFEPFPDNIKDLKEKFNNNEQVTIVEKAVHKKTGTEKLFINGEDTQGSLSKLYAESAAWNYRPNEFIEVETITLDEFINQQQITSIGIIKIDVEGAEQYIFNGAGNLLANIPDITTWIILECHLLVDWEMVTDIFKHFGFNFVNTELEYVDQLFPGNHYLIHKGIMNFTVEK